MSHRGTNVYTYDVYVSIQALHTPVCERCIPSDKGDVAIFFFNK
jgi:hypothetical protein